MSPYFIQLAFCKLTCEVVRKAMTSIQLRRMSTVATGIGISGFQMATPQIELKISSLPNAYTRNRITVNISAQLS